jgi:pilus assembly protein Flp/PilA
MMHLLARFSKLLVRTGGATAIEYGLIAAGIALVIIAAVGNLGTNVSSTFNTVAAAVGAGGGGSPPGCFSAEYPHEVYLVFCP